MRRFVIRKIKNGQVKIFGRIFIPDEIWMKYDGRLDGLKYAFGLYSDGGKYLPFVNLWGPEQNYKNHDIDLWIPDPQVVDGQYNWLIWRIKED
jgi:hypothetical protein